MVVFTVIVLHCSSKPGPWVVQVGRARHLGQDGRGASGSLTASWGISCYQLLCTCWQLYVCLYAPHLGFAILRHSTHWIG